MKYSIHEEFENILADDGTEVYAIADVDTDLMEKCAELVRRANSYDGLLEACKGLVAKGVPSADDMALLVAMCAGSAGRSKGAFEMVEALRSAQAAGEAAIAAAEGSRTIPLDATDEQIQGAITRMAERGIVDITEEKRT